MEGIKNSLLVFLLISSLIHILLFFSFRPPKIVTGLPAEIVLAGAVHSSSALGELPSKEKKTSKTASRSPKRINSSMDMIRGGARKGKCSTKNITLKSHHPVFKKRLSSVRRAAAEPSSGSFSIGGKNNVTFSKNKILPGKGTGNYAAGSGDFKSVHEAYAPDYGQDSTRKQKKSQGYFSLVRKILEAHKRYPRQARISGREGAVRLAFTIVEDGRVKNIQIIKKCTSWDLNRAAIRTVADSAPFPPPPEGIKVPLDLEISISFRFGK